MSIEIVPIGAGEFDLLTDYWWTCWVGMHWAFRRHAVVYWCCTGQLSPEKAMGILGIDTPLPLDIVIFYREFVTTLIPEFNLAQKIVEMTPKPERGNIKRFYAGHNTFEHGIGDRRTVSQLMTPTLQSSGLPRMKLTDDGLETRVPSFRMFFEGLRRTSAMRGPEPPMEENKGPLLFISSECPELISTIPSLVSTDPRHPEDIAQDGTVQDDVWKAASNAYREYPSVVGAEPLLIRRQRAIQSGDSPLQQRLNMLKFDHANKTGRRIKRR